MSAQDATSREALLRLGTSAAEAVAQVLEMLVPGDVSRGEVTVMDDGVSPFSAVVPGSVASTVSYAGDLAGANFFVVSPAAARALAKSERVEASESTGDADHELSELDVSAVAEVAAQAMAAAVRAMGLVLGQELETLAPETRVLASADEATDTYTAHATSTTFLIAGEPCRVIQLVPEQFVVAVVRALDGHADGAHDGAASASAGGVSGSTPGVHDALSVVNLRVWAELGRARLPLGSALALPPGAVVDLDCAPDDPIDFFVNGVRFARGHLLVTDDGEWAIVIDELTARQAPAAPATSGASAPKTRPRVMAA